MIHLSVTDSGVGIAPDKLLHLFEFMAGRSTSGTAGEKGTGLGLLLCREFVEKHGGRIWAESEPGCGSSFHVLLPGANNR
jgi:two-component system sensor histidine kinase/response regulator